MSPLNTDSDLGAFDELAHFLSQYVIPDLEQVGSKVMTPGAEPTDLELKVLQETLEASMTRIRQAHEKVSLMLIERH